MYSIPPTHMGAASWDFSTFEREAHPLETGKFIKLEKWIMVTNYLLINFVPNSLIEDHKGLEVVGGKAQRLSSHATTHFLGWDLKEQRWECHVLFAASLSTSHSSPQHDPDLHLCHHSSRVHVLPSRGFSWKFPNICKSEVSIAEIKAEST